MTNILAQGCRHLVSTTKRILISPSKRACLVLLGLLAITFTTASISHAVVVIRDGFGDGDVDNNGTAFETEDAVGDYIPFFDSDTMTQDDSPAIFTANTMVTGPTVADDVNDVGIRWLTTGGFGSSNDGSPSARPRVIDDSAGALPETVGNQGFLNTIPAVNTIQHIPALDSGLALSVEAKGRGRSISGFFESDGDYSTKDSTISLGPKVGDSVKVSFDFRVWMSAPNYNGLNAVNQVPDFGELRFGLYQDTDDELGQSNPFAGSGFTPATWGLEPGLFRGDLAGPGGTNRPDASGDAGWYARVPLQDADSTRTDIDNDGIDQQLHGRSARINEETNTGNTERHLLGTDNQTVALPDDEAPTPEFLNLSNTSRYNISLTLTRFDETGGSTDPNTDGDNIMGTLTVTDLDTLVSFSFDGFDSLDEPFSGGFETDSWDYFSIQVAGGGAASDPNGTGNEFDFIMDNFEIDVSGSNAPDVDLDDDGDVDGADFLAIQRTDPSLIPLWQSSYGNGVGPLSSVSAVPEPSTLVMIGLGSLLALSSSRRQRS